MAKGQTKNIKAHTKRAYKQSQNFKHSSVLNHNIKYSKKEIETMLFATMHDEISFYHFLPIEKQIIFCNCVQHIIVNTDEKEKIERLSNSIENSRNNALS